MLTAGIGQLTVEELAPSKMRSRVGCSVGIATRRVSRPEHGDTPRNRLSPGRLSEGQASDKGRETIFNLPNKFRGDAAVVLRDETPDIDQIPLWALGYVEGSGFCNCCSPFLMMRSGSKLCTRRALISDSPS